MNLKSLNELIWKYEIVRKKVDSKESRRMLGPYTTIDKLRMLDEFIKDLKEVNNGRSKG